MTNEFNQGFEISIKDNNPIDMTILLKEWRG